MLLQVGLVLAVVSAVTVAGAWWIVRRPLPKRRGRMRLPGLSAPVEVLRDIHGVPHLFAANLEDAAFAQGVVHVQERLWQMELNRRVGSGRLSELFGERALAADRHLRRLGLRRAAEEEVAHVRPEERALLEAYARGVNAAMARHPRPLELRILRVVPEPWTPVDSLCWAKVMSLSLCANLEAELFRARLVERVGPERAAALELLYPAGLPAAVPPGTKVGDLAPALLAAYAEIRPFLPLGIGGGSNNWVVAGSRTATGKPLLANDPHLVLSLPGIWYETHLVAGDVDAYGVTMPGLPGIVLGHNRHVAWGFTNSFADVQDLYLERFHPERPDEVEFQGRFEKARVVRETIRVKGRPDVVEEVRITRHGPVLTGPGSTTGLALRWTAYEPGHTVAAMVGMMRARDVHQFREALRDWHTPSQNVVFADDAGNIGFRMSGVVPIRAKGSGLTPVPGWSGDHEWTGYVPFEELPQAINPKAGFIATANNRVAGDGYPHHLTWDTMNGYRADRIETLIRATPRLGPKEFRDIQMDVFCAPGARFAATVRSVGLKPTDSIERQALDALLRWDGHARPESGGCAVYQAMLLAAMRRVFEPALGRTLLDAMMGRSDNPINPFGILVGRYSGVLVEAFARRDTRFLEAAEFRCGHAEPWKVLAARALSDAVAELRARMGDDVARWSWGRIHTLSLKHPLGSVKPLHLLFNGPTVPIGGDTDTPLQTAVVPHAPFGADAWSPSWRQIVDLAAPHRSVSVLPGGQSGHPGSPHYLDQFPLWLRGEYHAQWLDRPEIEAHLEGRLRLEPEAGVAAAGRERGAA